MSTQFVRDEAFARVPLARYGRWSIDAVVAEAERNPDHPEVLRHVVGGVRAPILLSSETPSQVADRARALADEARDPATRRRISKSTNVLVSRVMSYPVSIEDLGGADLVEQEIRDSLAGKPADRPEARRLLVWIKASVKWSQEHLGDRGAVVYHGDERHPHLHHLVPLRRRADDPTTADLSFWPPAAAEACVREQAREAGLPRQGKAMFAAGKAARRGILESYNGAVGSRMGHAIESADPRKRRKRREHLERRDLERELDATKAHLAESQAKLSAAEAEITTLRARVASLAEQGRAVISRARVWIGALRGDPATVTVAGEAPTITETKIDATLGVGPADIQRRRMVAI